MSEQVNNIPGGEAQQRTRRAKKNIFYTLGLKVTGVLIGFLYFPLSLDYLGAVKFGVFLTLLSVVDWFMNFDIGLGHGLRNKFGESIAKEDTDKAIVYVSTAYYALGLVILCLTGVLVLLNFTLPWPRWISVPEALTGEVRLLGLVVILAFGIRFVAANIYQLFYAIQRMALVELFSVITKATFLLLIIIIPFFVEDSLILFGSARSLTFALVPLLVGLYFFRTTLAPYRPRLAKASKKDFKDLFSLGSKFFLIKMAMLVIHQTNNFLIASFVSLEGVPQYEAAFKYLSIFMMLFVILNNQLWPSNLEAFAKGDIAWMQKSMRIVRKIWIGTLLLAALMVWVAPWIYSIWLGEKLDIPWGITLSVAFSICATTWVNMHNIVLNGTGKITLQMWAWIVAALINIPASLFFVYVLDLGVVGIVMGTIASLVPLVILSPIQVHKILRGSATGIWYK